MTSGDLPEGIGPHEGREFELMEQGDKHVALFYEIKPDGLEDFLQNADFDLLDWEVLLNLPNGKGQISIPYWIVFRRGFEGKAARLKQLCDTPSKGDAIAQIRETGQILGYKEAHIDVFIAHWQDGKSADAPQ